MRYLIALLFSVASFVAHAEQFAQLGDYQVHYNTFNSTFISPEVASHYGLTRSNNRGLINITVLDKNNQPVTAQISGGARNLIGNTRELTFKEITEQQAIYYIAEVPFRHEEHYRFNLAILLPNGMQYPLNFEYKFYQDLE